MKLTPTEELILDVLAARYRLGETLWTFSSRHSKALDSLEAKKLISGMHGITENTLRASLTELGKKYALSSTYTPQQPIGEEEFAVESRTVPGAHWDRIDTGREWSTRYGIPYSKKEAKRIVETHRREQSRLVHRFVGPWEPLED